MELGQKQFAQIVAQVEEVARLVDAISTIASSGLPVLLLGPRSTAVDLIAGGLHVCSPRRSRPFVKAACAVHAESILESQPARPRPARGAPREMQWGRRKTTIEVANGGTLFVDQVQNASPAVQLELLRLVTDHEYVDSRRGEMHRADLRLVVSAWTDLERRCERGEFRKDLFDKLMTIQLRKGSSTREWILEVIGLLRDATPGRERGGALPSSLAGEMERYSWSSEVRRLRQAIEKCLKGNDDILEPAAIFFDILQAIGQQRTEDLAHHQLQAIDTAVERCVDTYEFFEGHMYEKLTGQLQRALIQRAMVQCNGALSRAARILGISIHALEARVEELGLDGARSHTA